MVLPYLDHFSGSYIIFHHASYIQGTPPLSQPNYVTTEYSPLRIYTGSIWQVANVLKLVAADWPLPCFQVHINLQFIPVIFHIDYQSFMTHDDVVKVMQVFEQFTHDKQE